MRSLFSAVGTRSAALGIVMLIASSVVGAAQTLADINKATGLRETLVSIQKSFRAGAEELPKPLPEAFAHAWKVASEEAFDPDTMLAGIEMRMEGKLTLTELSSLSTFLLSPLGQRITALEIEAAQSSQTEEEQAEGKRILGELSTKDPARLEIYRNILDDLNAVDNMKAVTLNFMYAMIAGMQAAVGQSLPDDDMAAAARTISAGLLDEAESFLMASMAFNYRKLPTHELAAYSEFLASPAGNRYYDLGFYALGEVIAQEARAFGHKLFVVMGYRKA